MVKRKGTDPGERSAKKKMVVYKVNHSERSGFNTQGMIFETKPALYKNKMFTFSSVIARELGFTEGTMRLTLVWDSYRKAVAFKRDSHRGGGWRSRRKEFKEFFEAVGFKENQCYEVFQVPGSGDPAFKFVKSWEWFPTGGSNVIPEGYDTSTLENPDAEPSRTPEKRSRSRSESPDEVVWRRPVGAHRSSGERSERVKKKRKKQQKETHRQLRQAGSGKRRKLESGVKVKEQARKVKKLIVYKEVVKFGPPGRVKVEPVWK